MQIQFIEWEKIFAGDATNKGLIPKTCKNLIHLNIKKGNLVEQWAENIFEFLCKWMDTSKILLNLLLIFNVEMSKMLPSVQAIVHHTFIVSKGC